MRHPIILLLVTSSLMGCNKAPEARDESLPLEASSTSGFRCACSIRRGNSSVR